jgi:hypothetical protein
VYKFVISTLVLTGLAVGVGFALSGDDTFDWRLTAGLVGLVVAGEALRVWIGRGRSKRRTPTGT